ncbi:MAG: hypothetical protein FWG89_04715 [Treponema sp.]|nr:hypothetical protein [Treponema sp.]
MNLPKILDIGSDAFSGTGTQALTITLNNSAPFVLTAIFSNIHSPKNVTVRIPTGAAGYGLIPFNNMDTVTNNWGNAFRGRGWNGNYMSGTVNPNINLTFVNF